MSRIVARDVRSTTAINIGLIQDITRINLWTARQSEVKEALVANEAVAVPDQDRWRIPYLIRLLSERSQAYFDGRDEDVQTLSSYIDSLAIN